MRDVRIRSYAAADLAAIIELFNGSVRHVAVRDYSPAQIEAWAPTVVNLSDWSERMERKPTFVAERGSEIVGFSDLEPGGHIDMMFVHPDHQGQGVARRLLNHVVERAIALGLNSLTTDASITARPFFERNGFKVVQAQEIELRGQSFRNYRMAREL